MINDHDLADGPLSDNEDENLRMENELMRLKMQAELGAQSYSSGDLDPALENEFLKHVMAFEQNYADAKRVKIFDLLGKPEFKKADELNDAELRIELEKVTGLLNDKNIDVYFGDGYDNRVKYAFITDELFEHETDDLMMPGMMMNFDYEEFHPDHQKDIANRAEEFITGWFEQGLDERAWCFADEFVVSGGRTITKKQLAEKLKQIFDSYQAFTDAEYKIFDIRFEFKTETGMGHAEGQVKYKAILESGEEVLFKGPFKLYLSCEQGWWDIFHIVFPGFEY